MVYKTFQETITSRLQSRLGTGYRLIVSKVPKNNGLFLDGLTITLRDQTASPVIYLNYYYERFLGSILLSKRSWTFTGKAPVSFMRTFPY